MKKYLIALLALLTFVYPCFAVEQTEEEYEEVELNAFGFPDKSFVKLIESKHIDSRIIVNEKPACSDNNLINKIRETAKPLITSPSLTITNKRRNILITKNIDNFTDLSIDEAYEMENRVIKARLIELKINKRIDNKNIKLCQSDNPILKDKLYILMYDDNNDIKVELLNLSMDDIPEFYFYNN